jgi:hypothetical protein
MVVGMRSVGLRGTFSSLTSPRLANETDGSKLQTYSTLACADEDGDSSSATQTTIRIYIFSHTTDQKALKA